MNGALKPAWTGFIKKRAALQPASHVIVFDVKKSY